MAEFERIATCLADTIRNLLGPIQANSASSPDNFSFESSESNRNELSTSISDNHVDNQLILKLLSRVDGGGIELLTNVEELRKIIAKKPEYFYHICESYTLGLVCYGSFYPVKPIVHDFQRIKE